MINNISSNSNHLIRQRINTLLTNAFNNQIIIVCAGAGCGKTHAVYDFLQQQEFTYFWLQVSERDNSTARFWENIVDSTARVNKTLADKYREIGFPVR